MAGEIYVTEDGSFTQDPAVAVGVVQGNSVMPYTPPTMGGMTMPDGTDVAVSPAPVQTYAPPEPVERVVFDARGNPIQRPPQWGGGAAPQSQPLESAPVEGVPPALARVTTPDQQPVQKRAPTPAPAPGPRMSPTARRLAAAQTQEDADWQAYDAINQEAQQRVRDAEVDAMMQAEERSMLGERRAQITDDARKRLEAVDAQHAAEVQRGQAEIDKLTSEIREATPRDRRTKGQRVASAIAIALGGLGQAYQARAGINAPNAALQLVNDAIDRDFEQQRAAMNALREEKAAKESRLGRLEAALGDKRQAVYAWRAAELDDYADEANQLAQKYAGTAQARAYADAAAQLQAESAKLKIATSTARTNMRMAEQSRAEAAAAAGKRGADPLELRMRLAKVREAEANAIKAENEAAGGGKADPKRAEKLAALDQAIQTIDMTLAKREEAGRFGRSTPGTDAKADLETLGENLTLQLNKAYDAGAMDAGVQGLLDRMKGDPTSFWGGADVKLNRQKQILKARRAGLANSQGGTSELAAAGNEEEL